MAQTRHLIIDVTQIPHVVAYEITFDNDTASPEYETIHSDTTRHAIIASDEGEVGWTWSEADGLKPPVDAPAQADRGDAS
ncbi:hypothetical protein [Methylobacterium sp. CM6244]